MTTMPESFEEMGCKVKEEKSEDGVQYMVRKFRVPERYMEGDVEMVRRLRNRVVNAGKHLAGSY